MTILWVLLHKIRLVGSSSSTISKAISIYSVLTSFLPKWLLDTRNISAHIDFYLTFQTITILISHNLNRLIQFMKYTSILLLFLSFFLVACSDKENEPKSNEDKLMGYWAITHIQTIEHIGSIHNTNDKDVPAHGLIATTPMRIIVMMY